MLGRFSEEALKVFAASHNLNTGNQDFSEGVFDFKVCQKPNGEEYGIPDEAKCAAPNKEVKGSSFLGIKADLGIGKQFGKELQNPQRRTLPEAKELLNILKSVRGRALTPRQASAVKSGMEALTGPEDTFGVRDSLKYHISNLKKLGLGVKSPSPKPAPKPASKPAPAKPRHSRGEIINQADYAYFMAIQAGASDPMQARKMARQYLSEKGYDTSQISDSDWRAIREQNMR